MGYIGDGRLELHFGKIGRFDFKYFGRWEIDLVGEQQNGRNGKIHESTYVGAGRLAVIKVGDWEIETPIRGLKIGLKIMLFMLFTPGYNVASNSVDFDSEIYSSPS